MRIYLVRHGDADAEIPEGLGDEARALTTKARHTLVEHFDQIAERIGTVDLVLTSPLVRTVQTAQILAASIRHEGFLKAHRSLLPDMPVGSIDAVLAQHVGQSLVLVGHQPSMGAMAAHLMGVQPFPKPVNPGTVIALELPEDVTASLSKLLFYAAPGQPVLDTLG